MINFGISDAVDGVVFCSNSPETFAGSDDISLFRNIQQPNLPTSCFRISTIQWQMRAHSDLQACRKITGILDSERSENLTMNLSRYHI